MGHYADKFLHKTEKEEQKVYLNTGPSPPYARKCSFCGAFLNGNELCVKKGFTLLQSCCS